MTVVVLRHSGYWCKELLASETNLVLVDLADSVVPDDAITRYSRVYRVRDWGDLGALAAIAGDLATAGEDVAMVYSPTEYTQAAAGYLRAALGLDPGAVRAVLATRDKRLMKQLAEQAGLAATPWCTVRGAELERDLEQVAATLRFPVVAKPVDGFGTIDTEVLESVEDISEHASRVRLGQPGGPQMFAVEQFVEGTEYHADALLNDGEPVVLVISRYTVPPRDLRAGKGPDLSLALHEDDAPDLYAAVRDALRRFAAVAGLPGGPVHFEFFDTGGTSWGPGGLMFSEIASRIGGGTIADLVGARCGVNLRVLTVAQGLGVDLASLGWSPSAYRTLGLLNLTPTTSGTIRSLPDRDALAAEPGVVFASVPASVGSRFDIGVSTGTWTAIVILGGDTPEDVRRRADEIVARYPIEMD
jgi:biotin carboxylase